jgi:hypothetical protein
MIQKSTILYYYTLNEDEEECGVYDLATLNPANNDDFAQVYDYLDSLCVEVPESLVRSILEKI